jgi:DnaK suppressor protein
VDRARARELLERERSRLEKATDDVVSERGDATVYDDQHGEARSADLAREELEEGQVETLREELDGVGRAEKRLIEGAYGPSVESGEPIPDERLEAVPWAERTIESSNATTEASEDPAYSHRSASMMLTLDALRVGATVLSPPRGAAVVESSLKVIAACPPPGWCRTELNRWIAR